MGRISSGIGLISGINSKDIIDQLMALEERPKLVLQNRIDLANKQKLAYADLVTRLTALKLSATTLKKITTFQQASAATSNEDVITASASAGAAQGTYQFRVARLVASQQSISGGFASESTKVGAGSLTIEMGGGEIYSQTPLSLLNGGAGVRRGTFRITDGSGKSADIDISAALTLDDVVRQINTSLDISVKAEIRQDKLVLTDLSGQSTTAFSVADLAGGHAAADLGIAGAGANGVLTGTDINYLGRDISLSQLNDGRGVRTSSAADFSITASDGASYDISLAGASTLGAVFDAISTATSGKVIASVAPDGKSLRLTDSSGGAGALQVTALNGSTAAADLGIEGTSPGNTLDGKAVFASLNTILLSSLRGGQGLTLGSISIADRSGAAKVIDLSGARTVQDVLDLISNDTDISVTARLKQSGNGIEIVDDSGGTGNLVIADSGSTTAAELGIAGTFALGSTVVRGANLQRQWISQGTSLSTYNGGKGVTPGKIKITNSQGKSATIEIDSSAKTLADVIAKINSAQVNNQPLGVVASINANGDGLLLTDSAGGSAKLKVEEVDGTTAADLNIKGTATDTTIDGTFEKTIAITDADDLSDVLDKINLPGYALAATIINDGSATAPYRLSLTARNAGRTGRVVFDAGTTSLQTTNLVEAQDAVVFYGGGTAAQSIMLTSGTNKLTNVIKGVTIDLHAVSASPVTVSITDNVDNVVGELKKFADNFSQLVQRLHDLTKYDSATKTKGVLLGEGTVQQVESEIYAMVQGVVNGAGQYRILADVGLKSASGAKLEFDESKFRAAYAADPNSVRNLFTLFQAATDDIPAKKGFGHLMEDRISKLIDPASGILTLENKALDQRAEQFQDRIEDLDKRIAAKRARLERQFANLESVLANLQSQQQALASLSSLTTTSK